jgi:primosomal protein N' (replication factor Y)
MKPQILRIAVPCPLPKLFDYRATQTGLTDKLVGCRVRIPFGNRKLVGVILEVGDESSMSAEKLRTVDAILDEAPILDAEILDLLRWAAAYYHHPIGDVVASALPVRLRQGHEASLQGIKRWLASDGADPETLSARAVRQRALLQLLMRHPDGLVSAELDAGCENWRSAIRVLMEKGLVITGEQPCWTLGEITEPRLSAPQLNPAQRQAVESVTEHMGTGSRFLLQGVTGSGKTEVYLELIEKVIEAGLQTLVLVPEIGLTPQLLRRFRERLGNSIAVLHSGLNDSERHCAWAMASSGEAQVIIGTRSAVFTPLERPGLIIIDEEHDASLKQQDGFRYHARDLAVMRAHRLAIPIVLGSATPSLESLRRCEEGAYELLRLPQRAGTAKPPNIKLLDMRKGQQKDGLSGVLIDEIHRHLKRQGQVLLFLNRRGFAPTLLCEDCGWIAHCQRCDARMTWHEGSRLLRCHHCGAEQAIPRQCGDCGSERLYPLGQGTERIEQTLTEVFPDVTIERIDRDSTRRKGALESSLARAHAGESRILIGTQMLAKGHDFPGVTLVGILDCDQGLFSADFRAAERMAQLITQVAGRAGRAERQGEVLIQTRNPDHPLLQTLIHKGFEAFSKELLEERRMAGLPPFAYLALLRVEAQQREAPARFISQLLEALPRIEDVDLLGPVPAPMEKRAGRFRYQLLISAWERGPLHAQLHQLMHLICGMPGTRKVRWSLDVDPVEMF